MDTTTARTGTGGDEKTERSFGPFGLIERLGAGGMGEVWLARTRVRGAERLVAVKLLPDALMSDRESVARFVDEVRISVLLQHAHIASVLDVGRVGPRHYLAMEFVDGVDLRTILTRAIDTKRPVPMAIAVALIDDVLAGLDAAHCATDPATGAALGVVHRDVSPHNVLVGVDGAARVIDFGLALSTLKREKTEPDVVLGKAAYMAPEQARGVRVGPGADVFSAAVVLFELITARRFYGALAGTNLYLTAGRGGFLPENLGDAGPLVSPLLHAWQPAVARPASAARWAEMVRAAVPRASHEVVAAWLAAEFPDAPVRAAARARRLAAPSDDATEPLDLRGHRSLLDDERDDRLPRDAGGASLVYSAPGVWGLARVPAPGVVHVILRGHGDEAAGAWQRQMVDDELARTGAPVQFFSDVEQLGTHDAVFRQQMTEWQGRVRGKVTQLVLFRSQLVVLAISIANKLSGGGTEVTSSRARFEAELAQAVARRR